MSEMPDRIYLNWNDCMTGGWPKQRGHRSTSKDIEYVRLDPDTLRSLAIVLRSVLEHTDEDSRLGLEAEQCEWLLEER